MFQWLFTYANDLFYTKATEIFKHLKTNSFMNHDLHVLFEIIAMFDDTDFIKNARLNWSCDPKVCKICSRKDNPLGFVF